MKFAFLLVAVSAISIQKNGPDSENDTTNTYTVKLNNWQKAIDERSKADVAQRYENQSICLNKILNKT